MNTAELSIMRRYTSLSMLGLFMIGVLLSAVLGALTNAINVNVSRTYFYQIFGQTVDWDQVPRAGIAEGILEATLMGAALPALSAVVIGFVSHGNCPFRTATRYLSRIILGAAAGWGAGGLIAIGPAALSPSLYQHSFDAPKGWGQLLRYAWVGGSIWGVELGGLVSCLVFLVNFRNDWRQNPSAGEART